MNKLNTSLFISILCFYTSITFGQDRPFQLGAYVQAEFGQVQNNYTIDYTTVPLFGIGAQIHYQLNDQWSLVSGLGISRLKHNIQDRELRFGCDFQMPTRSSFNTNVSAYFADVSMLIKYRPQIQGRLYLIGGAVLKTNIRESGESILVECGNEIILYTEEMSVNYFTRFNMDILVGGGYMILKNNPDVYIQPSVRYGISPLTHIDIDVTDDHLLSFGVTLGVVL